MISALISSASRATSGRWWPSSSTSSRFSAPAAPLRSPAPPSPARGWRQPPPPPGSRAGRRRTAFPVVVTVAVQAACFIGTEPAPQVVANRRWCDPAGRPTYSRRARLSALRTVPARPCYSASARHPERRADPAARARCWPAPPVTRTDVAPAPKGGGEAEIGDDFAQQRQIFAEDLILQGHVRSADHQRFVLFPRNSDAGNEIRQGFPDTGRGFNRQMSPVVPGERFATSAIICRCGARG